MGGKCGQLQQYGEQYRPADEFNKVALKKSLVGKTKGDFDLWKSETKEFDGLLRKVKEHAKSNKLDNDAARGRAGVAVGAVESFFTPLFFVRRFTNGNRF